MSGLQESLNLYDNLFQEFLHLQQEYNDLHSEKVNIQKVMVDIQEQHEKNIQEYKQRDNDLVGELNNATELAEKQNALIITLEAKVRYVLVGKYSY